MTKKKPLPVQGTPIEHGVYHGDLHLYKGDPALSDEIREIRGSVILAGYDQTLPSQLTRIHGHLGVAVEYDSPLPKLQEIKDGISGLDNLRHPLPDTLTTLAVHDPSLPRDLGATGELRLFGYKFPLPSSLITILGSVNLYGYKHPLPDKLDIVIGSLDVRGYRFPLPPRLRGVVGSLDGLNEYDFRLPSTFSFVNGDLLLDSYKFPLPYCFSDADGVEYGDYPFKDQLQKQLSKSSPAPSVAAPVPGTTAHVHEEDLPGPVDTPEFRAWFDGSHAVDADGIPLVLYHGTMDGGFVEFKPEKKDAHHPGFYASTDIRQAATYMREGKPVDVGPLVKDPTPSLDGTNPASKKGIYRLYASVRSPFVADAEGREWNDLKIAKYPGIKKLSQVATAAKKDGYDSAIFRNVRDSQEPHIYNEPADVYVMFEPTQLKSARYNRGTYDPKDPDIRKNPGQPKSRRKTSRRSRKTSRS